MLSLWHSYSHTPTPTHTSHKEWKETLCRTYLRILCVCAGKMWAVGVKPFFINCNNREVYYMQEINISHIWDKLILHMNVRENGMNGYAQQRHWHMAHQTWLMLEKNELILFYFFLAWFPQLSFIHSSCVTPFCSPIHNDSICGCWWSEYRNCGYNGQPSNKRFIVPGAKLQWRCKICSAKMNNDINGFRLCFLIRCVCVRIGLFSHMHIWHFGRCLVVKGDFSLHFLSHVKWPEKLDKQKAATELWVSEWVTRK